MPTNASIQRVNLPSAGGSSTHVRTSSTDRGGMAPPSSHRVSGMPPPAKIPSNRELVLPARASVVGLHAARPTASLTQAESSSRPRSFATAPTSTRPAISSSRMPAPSTSRSTFRSTTTTRPPINSSPARPRAVPTNGISRPSGLPQPGTGPTARSAVNTASTAVDQPTRLSRTFGGDAGSTLNRTSRPTPSIPALASTKLSAGPASTSNRVTTNNVVLPRTKATSTPASSLVRPTTTSISTNATTRLPTAGRLAVPPKSSNTGQDQKVRSGSGLPRPTSRLPVPGSKISAPPGSGASGLAGLRERLDRLQARQIGSRRM